MYNPISLNVIRQSLKLSGVPQPMKIRRLDFVKFPTDTVVTAYRAVWDGSAVMKYTSMYAPWHPEVAFHWFTVAINDCFCADIFTTDWDFDAYDDTLSITICTRFVEHEAVQ